MLIHVWFTILRLTHRYCGLLTTPIQLMLLMREHSDQTLADWSGTWQECKVGRHAGGMAGRTPRLAAGACRLVGALGALGASVPGGLGAHPGGHGQRLRRPQAATAAEDTEGAERNSDRHDRRR